MKVYNIEERFWQKIERTATCWLWTDVLRKDGYGQFKVNGKMVLAHRYSYQFLVGTIPEGLGLDHLCRVRHCVNPEHLEPVTSQVNILRSPIANAAKNALKTECHRGHPFTEENTAYVPNQTKRYCRACRVINNRKASDKRRALRVSQAVAA